MLLVTGITGHTGRYFLQELIKNKYEKPIRCVVRKTSDTSLLDRSGLNFEKVYGNLDDEEFIRSVMVGVDQIMHIYNIHYSSKITEIAIEHNVSWVILVHTTGIYSKFKYASQAYKDIEQEIFNLNSKIGCTTKVTILRPTMIYGDLCDHNISKFIKMVDHLRIMPIVNGGRSLIQPVNARDLGRAFYTVMMSPKETQGKTYDLSGEEPMYIRDVLKLISNNLDKKICFVSIPLEVGVLCAKLLKAFTFGKFNYVEKVQRMGEDRSYSHTKAEDDFNYRPMSFEEGIKIEVAEYLSR